jgi:hypothetical protein
MSTVAVACVLLLLIIALGIGLLLVQWLVTALGSLL